MTDYILYFFFENILPDMEILLYLQALVSKPTNNKKYEHIFFIFINHLWEKSSRYLKCLQNLKI